MILHYICSACDSAEDEPLANWTADGVPVVEAVAEAVEWLEGLICLRCWNDARKNIAPRR